MCASDRRGRVCAAAQALTSGRTLRLTACGAALIAACYGLARFGYGLFAPTFAQEFGLDRATVGAIAAASYVAYCVAVVASSLVTPRLGARAVAVAAGCLATAGTASIALATGPVTLAAGVVVAGSSTGLASPPLAHAVAAGVRGPLRDRVQSFVNAGTGLGVLVSGPVALLAQAQWRAAWLGFAALCGAVTVWTAAVLPRLRAGVRPESCSRGESGHAVPRSRVGARPKTCSRGESGRSVLRLRAEARPPVVPRPLVPAGAPALAGAAAVMGMASAAPWTFGVDVLTDRLGAGPATAAWILLGSCGLLGALAGDLGIRLGLRRAWSAAMLALAAAIGALALAPQVAPLALAAAAAFGGTYITLTGLLLVWSTRVYAGHRAAGAGVAFLVLALGQAGGALLVGGLADALGPGGAFGAAAGLAVLGGAVRPRRRSPRRAYLQQVRGVPHVG